VRVLLAVFLAALVASVPPFVLLRRQHALGRTGLIAYAGMEIVLIGLILSPGIAWGDADNDSAINPISTLIFFVGVGVLTWAAISWGRARARSRAS
jgi:hypothetical protein